MSQFDQTFAVAQRIITELFRRRRSLIFWIIFPIILLLINGSIVAERTEFSQAEAFQLAAPSSLVGAALFFSCLGGSVATVVAEREQKTIKRLFISPLSGGAYFLGIFLAHSLLGISQTCLVYLLSLSFGAKFEGAIALGLMIIFLSIISYVGLGFILGTQLAKRTEDVNTLVATFGVPLLIIGGAFFPSSFFPENLLKIAKYNPIYHMNEALIAIWTDGANLSDISEHFRFLLIFSLFMLIGGWLSYQRMLNQEKQL